MKRVIIVGVVFIQLCGNVLMAEEGSIEQKKVDVHKLMELLEAIEEEKNKDDDSYIMKAPLQSELVEVYRASEKVGETAGKGTKNFFCSELHWDFFCKGEK